MIELLVVIVVFLVGILAIVQVFPPGLGILRTAAFNTSANQLGTAEMQRIQGRSNQLAEMIVPVRYVNTAGGVRVQIDSSRLTSDLMPSPGTTGGKVDQSGNVIVDGVNIGSWPKVSGANLFSRVIGESTVVPAPRRVPGLPAGRDFGGVLQLTFAPAYYYPTQQGIGEDGVLQVYGNDYRRRFGNYDASIPNIFRWAENEYYYVPYEPDNGLPSKDEIWIAPNNVRRKYRIALSFAYDNGGRTEQYDVIVQADLDPNNVPSYARTSGRYWILAVDQLVAQPDIYSGGSQFNPSNFLYADPDSVRLQRVYQEIPGSQSFSNDPYEYRVAGTGTFGTLGFCLGTVLLNPNGFNSRFVGPNGTSQALLARVDYTVYDWRLIRDEFRVPPSTAVGSTVQPRQIKLTLNGIKSFGTANPDQTTYNGTGLTVPNLITYSGGGTSDVIVQDMDTGAILLGNQPNDASVASYPQNPDSGWTVDKINGQILFRDVDGDASNGMSVWACYPTGDVFNPWTPRQLLPDVSHRNVRVLYMGHNEWSVQPFKAARQYRVSAYGVAAGLSPGQVLIGGSPDTNGNPIGSPYRIYSAPYDLGQKIVVGEMWVTTGGQPYPVYDQEFQFSGIENVNGVNLAYADIRDKVSGGAVFDWSRGYAVRRVRGASLWVRVMWNPTSMKLTDDQAANFNDLEFWMRSWRKTDNESLQIGGND